MATVISDYNTNRFHIACSHIVHVVSTPVSLPTTIVVEFGMSDFK